MSTTEEEEQARKEAEARRQRILEGADERMETVAGLLGQDAATSDASSSKIAAMRRRRFKKKAKDTSATEEPEKASGAKEPEEGKDAAVAKETEDEVVEEINTPGVQEMDKKKKKYQGVAKMRRKMLQEKKQQEAAQQETAAKESVTVHRHVHKKSKADRLPILMHAVVVILLFLAGLDVGLQQGLDYGPDVITVVQTGLAPREAKFLSLIPKSFLPDGVEVDKRSLLQTDDDAEYKDAATEDEFASAAASDDKQEESANNIDPLFGVDLDKYMEGPGLFMLLGRFAVSVHRVNLAIFYYLPRRIIWNMYRTFMQLLQFPPLLALIALAVRQVLGKLILGAKLPEKVVDESQHKDVVSMVKNFVQGVVLRSFPTATSIYDAWVHLRADMYVVICGVLVGLAWTHSNLVGLPESTSVPESAGAGSEVHEEL